MPTIPLSSEETRLLQLYSVWTDDQPSLPKAAAVALALVSNGEDGQQSYSIEFMRMFMEEYFDRRHAFDVVLLRGMFVWWTRAEQCTREVGPLLTQAHGPSRLLLQAAVANAWYKAWNWALEERPENAGFYEGPAGLHWENTLELFKDEKTMPALRGLLQIALKDEPWFQTKRDLDKMGTKILA